MPLTPEKRDSFIKLFDLQFGEGAAEQMFKAYDQMHIKKSRLCQCTCDHGHPLRITDSRTSIRFVGITVKCNTGGSAPFLIE